LVDLRPFRKPNFFPEALSRFRASFGKMMKGDDMANRLETKLADLLLPKVDRAWWNRNGPKWAPSERAIHAACTFVARRLVRAYAGASGRPDNMPELGFATLDNLKAWLREGRTAQKADIHKLPAEPHTGLVNPMGYYVRPDSHQVRVLTILEVPPAKTWREAVPHERTRTMPRRPHPVTVDELATELASACEHDYDRSAERIKRLYADRYGLRPASALGSAINHLLEKELAARHRKAEAA
jgi:hypothetical protein